MRILSFRLLLILAATVVASVAHAAGMAHNENFVVMAPDQPLAEQVLAQADHFRKQVAEDWLGEELPPSVGRVIIHVDVDDSAKDHGLFWPIDTAQRKYHKLWLTTSRERAVGSTLHHEMTHVVFAIRYPHRLPAWADEGAASLHDDPQRREIQRRIIDWYARTDNWPNLQVLLQAPTIAANDQASYSAAASLTQYLLTRGDKANFLRFAMTGQTAGWERAVQQHYGINSVSQLQFVWQSWVSSSSQGKSPPAQVDSPRLSSKAVSHR
jgi:hypothetical protein